MTKFFQHSAESAVTAPYRMRSERTVRLASDALRPAPTVAVDDATVVRVRANAFSVRRAGRAQAVHGGWS